jgi:hypothetical protein
MFDWHPMTREGFNFAEVGVVLNGKFRWKLDFKTKKRGVFGETVTKPPADGVKSKVAALEEVYRRGISALLRTRTRCWNKSFF